MAPTGYLNAITPDRKSHVEIDPMRSAIVKQIFEKVAYENWSGRKVYHWLKFDLNFKAKSNKHMSLSNLYRLLQTSFYYGVFEYPRNSGNWYQGKHEPLISKELFDLVQEQLKRARIVREEKEFAFTRLITCGLCGSGVTADEKYKKLKNGNTATYIYYGCTRSRDHSCKLGYLREELLIEEMTKLIDKIDINEIGLKRQFEDEVNRYNHFQKSVLRLSGKVETSDESPFDIRAYAKYILKEGKMAEKRELLGSLKSRLVIKKNKTLSLKEYETTLK